MNASNRQRRWVVAISVFCFAISGLLFCQAGGRVGPASPDLEKVIQNLPQAFRFDGIDYNELPRNVDINPILTEAEKSRSPLPYLGKLRMLKLYEMPEGHSVRIVQITPFIDSKSGLFFTSSLERTNDRANLFFQEKHFFATDSPGLMYVTTDGHVVETNSFPKHMTVGLIKDQGVIIWHSGNMVTQSRSNCFRYFRLERGRGKEGAQVLRPVFSR
jgi:hypothetical protein